MSESSEKIEFFREFTLRVCSSLDIDQALLEVFEFLKTRIPIETIGLGFSDINTKTIRVVSKLADSGVDFIWEGEDEIHLAPTDVGYIERKPSTQPDLMLVNKPSMAPPEILNMFPKLVSHSAVFLGLKVKGEDIGALLVSRRGLDGFNQFHCELLKLIRDPLSIAMINARRYRELSKLKEILAEDNRALNADIKRNIGTEVVGADFGLRQVMEQVRQIAPTNSSVLLLGETGTGKEVIANAIHMASKRRRGPLISMQCGAIPDTLLDSELFGHEKGAFTGAIDQQRGRFERAHTGTLFLDEIGELSAEAQVKLLRVLQEQKFERVGGTKSIQVDVRVVAATHRDLEQMVGDGTFREDLWYRLNVMPIRIPPLRLRQDDIPELVHHFIERKAQEMNLKKIPRASKQDIDRLKKYDWPGNVRELQNIVERSLILAHDGRISFPGLSRTGGVTQTNSNLKMRELRTLDEAMAEHITDVLEGVGWQIGGTGGAAEILKLNPSTLRFKMGKLGIKRPRLR